MNEVEGMKVAESKKGKVSKETSQTVPQTDRQEDVDKPGSASKPSLEQQKEVAKENNKIQERGDWNKTLQVRSLVGDIVGYS